MAEKREFEESKKSLDDMVNQELLDLTPEDLTNEISDDELLRASERVNSGSTKFLEDPEQKMNTGLNIFIREYYRRLTKKGTE